MDSSADRIEEQVNSFLDSLGSASVIKTETVVAAGTHPCIVVTIWYELV